MKSRFEFIAITKEFEGTKEVEIGGSDGQTFVESVHWIFLELPETNSMLNECWLNDGPRWIHDGSMLGHDGPMIGHDRSEVDL